MFGTLVLFAHSGTIPVTLPTLTPFLPLIIAHLRMNHSPDAPLALLLRFISSTTGSDELPDDLTSTLIPLLAPLSAIHPHPPTRLLLFRGLLSPFIARTRAHLRLVLLADLMSDTDDAPPQLRVAAIGLARTEIVQALRSGKDSLLASPHVMQVLAPAILRPSPPKLFETKIDAEEFVQTPEPARLTEALLFYFVVLNADEQNKVCFPWISFPWIYAADAYSRLESAMQTP